MSKLTEEQKEELIKAFVFDDFETLGRYTIEDVQEVIESDFEGYED